MPGFRLRWKCIICHNFYNEPECPSSNTSARQLPENSPVKLYNVVILVTFSAKLSHSRDAAHFSTPNLTDYDKEEGTVQHLFEALYFLSQ